MADLNGVRDERFDRVSDALARNLDAGVELGAGIYVEVDGQPVVDVWGGWQDRDHAAPWTDDTLVNLWSTTKCVTALAVLTLVDRGDLDVYAPVAQYWPEFAENGKDTIEVRHLLSHTSGLSGFAQPFSNEDAYDSVASASKLASQAPWWEPGTSAAYHATTFGTLNGELVRRVTGKSLGQFVADEIAQPMSADFHIGLDDADFGRVATMYPPVGLDLAASLPPDSGTVEDESVMLRTLKGSFASIDLSNTAEFRRAELGAVNGHGNARSVARIMSAVTLGGTANGVRLASPDTIDLIFDEQANGIDQYLNIPLRWGIGYALTPSGGAPFVRDGKVCFWGGWGGSLIVMDLDRRLTISYAMNQMQPGTFGSDVVAAYCDVIYDCFDNA